MDKSTSRTPLIEALTSTRKVVSEGGGGDSASAESLPGAWKNRRQIPTSPDKKYAFFMESLFLLEKA